MLGELLRGKRNSVVLASKIGQKAGNGPDDSELKRRAVVVGVEACLKRLQTDRLDICYLHAPDYTTSSRRNSMAAMQSLIRDGKVRFIGTSNYSSWQACQAHLIAQSAGCPGPRHLRSKCTT